MTFESLTSLNPVPGAEQDFRLAILDALLRTPHRDMEPYVPLFRHVHEVDPLFFGQLAAWYTDNGSVHDLRQLFSALLSVSDFSPEYREAGLAILESLPPYQVERVYRLLKGQKIKGKFVPGLAKSVPTSFRTAVKDYLREREADQGKFDSVALHARSALRTLYASLRIKPSSYAQAVIFENKPPEGSRLATLKKISASSDPAEQARLIVEHKIPYRVAVSALKQMTPSVLAALLSTMTPQEVINNLGALKKRGAMDNPDLRKLIEDKLEQAKGDKRVSALKTRQAVAASGVDADLAEKVAAVGDARIKTKGSIRKATALLIDKSGSLHEAIEVGKQLAAVIAPVCQNTLVVYAFDSMVYPIRPKGNEMSHWEAAFKGIKAGGSTACGAPVERLRKDKVAVEQVILVTDQQENSAPYLHTALKAYEAEMGIKPNVVILNVGSGHSNNYLVKKAQAEGFEVDTMTFGGDYYSLPNIVPMLSGGSRADLLNEIMLYPLPSRKRTKVATKELAAVSS